MNLKEQHTQAEQNKWLGQNPTGRQSRSEARNNNQAKQKGNKRKRGKEEEEEILLTFTGTIPSRLHDRVEGADS
jgi:hypothetical protein